MSEEKDFLNSQKGLRLFCLKIPVHVYEFMI